MSGFSRRLCLVLVFLGISTAIPAGSYLFSQDNQIAQVKNQQNREKKKFGVLIGCIDGRGQIPSITWMQEKRKVLYADVVTEPGVNKILADNTDAPIVANVKKRVEISVHHHGSKVIGLWAHDECAGNPVAKEKQLEDLRKAKKTVEDFGFGGEIVLLWCFEKEPDHWVIAEVK